jgi:hypothetical protein
MEGLGCWEALATCLLCCFYCVLCADHLHGSRSCCCCGSRWSCCGGEHPLLRWVIAVLEQETVTGALHVGEDVRSQ